MRRWWVGAMLVLALTVGLTPVGTQGQATRTTLYMVATAHLDSQWNWTVQDTIRDYIPKTFHTNFDFFEKYPNYKFTWEGAIHYMWFKEYHPDEWAKVQKYVADGPLAARRIVDRRGRHEHAVARVALPAGALRAAVLPAGVQRRNRTTSTCPTASASASRCRRSPRTPA